MKLKNIAVARYRKPVRAMNGRSCAGRGWYIGGVPNEGTAHGRQHIHRLEDAASRAGRHPYWHGASAAIYTIIESAKLCGLSPQAYLADVIDRLAKGW